MHIYMYILQWEQNYFYYINNIHIERERNPGRDMLILFNNSFPRLIMSLERLIKSSKRLIMSSERLIKSSERVIMSSEQLIKSSERVI